MPLLVPLAVTAVAYLPPKGTSYCNLLPPLPLLIAMPVALHLPQAFSALGNLVQVPEIAIEVAKNVNEILAQVMEMLKSEYKEARCLEARGAVLGCLQHLAAVAPTQPAVAAQAGWRALIGCYGRHCRPVSTL